MAPSGATVRELIAEIPDPDGGAPTRVRIGLDASREHGPAVHVAVQVDDPGVVASLKAEASALRQQLWHHGLELAQFAASSESNRGRDAETSQPGDSRALPGVRASRPRESQDRTTILEGIWA